MVLKVSCGHGTAVLDELIMQSADLGENFENVVAVLWSENALKRFRDSLKSLQKAFKMLSKALRPSKYFRKVKKVHGLYQLVVYKPAGKFQKVWSKNQTCRTVPQYSKLH